MSRTRLFMTTIVIAVVLYDLMAVSWFGHGIEDVGGTVSDWFASFGRYPVITIGLGYLLGHFFGWMKPTMPAGKRVKLVNLAQEFEKYGSSEGNMPIQVSRMHFRDWAKRIREIIGK